MSPRLFYFCVALVVGPPMAVVALNYDLLKPKPIDPNTGAGRGSAVLRGELVRSLQGETTTARQTRRRNEGFFTVGWEVPMWAAKLAGFCPRLEARLYGECWTLQS